MQKTALVVISAPGGGKGALAKKMVSEGWAHFDMGPHLKQLAVSDKTLQHALENTTKRGIYVPDEIAIPIMENYLLNDLPQSFIADGIPRTGKQAEIFYTVLEKQNFKVYTAYFLIPKYFYSTLRRRMLERGRSHENDEIIGTRFEEFERHNPVVIEFAHSWKHHSFRTFNGMREVEERCMAVKQLVSASCCHVQTESTLTCMRLSDC